MLHTQRVEDARRSGYSHLASSQWLALRCENLGQPVLLVVVLFGIVSRNHDTSSWNPVQHPATVSLSVTYALAAAMLTYAVTILLSEIEMQMAAVQRVKEYVDELPAEPDVVYDDAAATLTHEDEDGDQNTAISMDTTVEKKRDEEETKKVQSHRKITRRKPPPSCWPFMIHAETTAVTAYSAMTASSHSNGGVPIEFRNVSLRYRPGLALVLQHCSFQINAGERIGIVGRTGAGKSSLLTALFRMISPLEKGGIYISGVNIEHLSLKDLRSVITIIPQEPLLFSGTIRDNLDPFRQLRDDDIWAVIEHVGLRQRIEVGETLNSQALKKKNRPTATQQEELNDSNTLDPVVLAGGNHQEKAPSKKDPLLCSVGEKGSNFSTGERQLLCLARALLRPAPILLLDEATASVDKENDERIQRTIRQAFAGRTILVIAHRLDTVMECDRVLVMEAGRVAEFGPPEKLLQFPDGVFKGLYEAYQLAHNAGASPTTRSRSPQI